VVAAGPEAAPFPGRRYEYGVEFGVLGPVEIHHADRQVPAGSARERYVLASLLLNADRLVLAEQLIDTLWPTPPSSAKSQLQNLVSKLRTRLRGIGADSDDVIVTRPGGYELRLGRHRLDVSRFRELVAQAAESGEPATAAELLGQALSLWRGPALADVPEKFAAGARQALEEERLVAAEAKLDAELTLGRFDSVVRDAETLLAVHPYREDLHRRRMLALAGAGRPADAVAAYREAYQKFVDDLGVEPGAELRALEQRLRTGRPVTGEPARPVPRQLPPDAALTGRDLLRDGIADELRDGGTVLLVGPGGIGKTTLAAAAGRRLVDHFPDGQLYADLRGSHAQPADPYEVAGQFLRVLGVAGTAVPEDRQERFATYRSHLANGRILLLLDDAADEAQVRPLLPGAASCATVVTSRRQLAALLGVARITVPTLSAADSVRLLARAAPDRVAADPDAAWGIAELCGGLPLAVSIAAARLAAQPSVTLAEFRSRLAAERGRLDQLRTGDLDVRASIGLSYRALPDPARRLFRRLGLAGADWPGWVADAVLGTPAGSLLDGLIDVHLVEPSGRDPAGQERYRLHDLVAVHAAERGYAEDPDSDRVAALGRVLDGWLGLASAADEHIDHGMISAAGLSAPSPPVPPPAPDAAYDWFETERANLVAAVSRAAELDGAAPDSAERAGGLALRICGFLGVRAYDEDRVTVLEAACGAVRRVAADELLLRLLSALFAAYWDRGRYDRLPAIAAEQIDTARRIGDRQREVRALAQAGHASRVFGRLAEAAVRLDEAIERCDDDTPTQLLSTVYAYRASVHLDGGRPARALPFSERAVAIERTHDRPRILAWRLTAYAEILTDLGRLGEAEDALLEATAGIASLGDELTAATLAQKLAVVEIGLGRRDAAAGRLLQALPVAREHGDREAAALVLRTLGDLAVAYGRPGDGVTPLRESLGIWRALAARPLETARVLARLERVATALDDPDGALTYRRDWQSILDGLDLDAASLRLDNRPPLRL